MAQNVKLANALRNHLATLGRVKYAIEHPGCCRTAEIMRLAIAEAESILETVQEDREEFSPTLTLYDLLLPEAKEAWGG